MATVGEITKISNGHIKWKIQDLPLLFKEDDEEYSSPSFTLAGESWIFRIGLQILTDQENFLFIGLQRRSLGPPIDTRLEISLGSKTMVEQQYYKQLHFTTGKFEKKGNLCAASFFLDVAKLSDYVLTAVIKNPESSEDASDESLSQDFKKVLLDGQNHDLILKIGDKELKAHQDILRARSRVFNSMLNHDMKEKNSGVIEVPDCDPQDMEVFLSYVYSGKVEALDQSNMLGLYYIADKYEMEHLKDECSKFIKKSLSSTNICDIIQLAFKHSDCDLSDHATEYFMNNALEIMHTLEWQSFLKDNSSVGNELLIKSMEKLKA